MSNNTHPRPSFSRGRKWAIALNVLASSAALLLLVAMANYLASRHFKRYQWMADERYRLSPLTAKMLDSIASPVKVIVFFNPDNSLFGSVKGLINEYRNACPKLDVEFVDYVRAAGRADLIKTQYKLSSADQDMVIFDCNGRVRIVYDNELPVYDMTGVFSGKEARRTGFKGEQFFTSAIVGVTDAKPIKAHFLQGHGEHDPASEDNTTGYFKFSRVLQDKNILVEPLSLLTNDVPDDCQLLIIAGPRRTFSPQELSHLEEYLNHGGRALVLLMNPRIADVQKTGLERILSNWGVAVGDRLVTDESQVKAGHDQALYVESFGQHPIVRPLSGSRLGVWFPHSVRAMPGGGRAADTAKAVELAFTSAQGRESGTTNGPIPLAVAVEKGAIPGVAADRSSTRMVVVGDSFFLANASIEFDANRDFANLAVNWLLDRAQLLDIGPRPIHEYKISLSQSQMAAARWILLAGMPGGVLMFGWLVWLRRRN